MHVAWAVGAAGLGLLATRADAAEARYRFSIPPKSYADALIDLGMQANVSVVGTSACGAGGPASLSGSYALDDALRRLLAGAPCSYRIVDPRTVRIAPPAPVPEEPIRVPTLVAELMVTATKRPAGLGRIAAGVSAIPGPQLELTGAADIGRTTGQLAGVLTTNLGPGRDKLMIRGLSDGAFTGRARSTVSTYLDDAPINYNAPDPDLRLTDVERVEVVRGPQGALYGSGALTGIYRIVTRKPDLETVGGGVSSQLASTKGGSASRVLEGHVNLPLVRGQAGLRAVAYHDVQGGYLDNTSLRVSNVDRTTRDGGRLALRVQMSDAWQADFAATGQRLRSNDTQYTTPDIGRGRVNQLRETHKNDFAEGAVTLRGELGWASVSSSVAYVQHTYASQYDASEALEDFFANDVADLGLFYESARVSMLVEDLVLRSSGPGPFAWLVGAYAASTLEKTPSSLGVRNEAAGRLETIYRENRRDRVRELALYGEASYRFGDGWTAVAGGRLFETRVRTLADVTAAPPGYSRMFEGERTFQDILPTFSVQREFASGDLVYALYSEGFRPGGFNTGGFLGPIRPSRTTFVPDRLRNYELGAKLRLAERRLAVRSALFYDRWTNIQSDQYRPSGLAYTANVTDAWIVGLEAEVAYEFDFGLSLQANTLLSASEITRPNMDFAAELVGELPGVPEVSGGVLAIYERPLGALTLRLTGEASYVGRSAVSFDAARASRMGDYLRARLAAEVASDRWAAGVFVSNPTNDAGDTFAYGNPFSFRRDGLRQVTPQRPRTIGVRLAGAF
ncbi:TonB-dependent receptor [Phenylobacterium sp.]|uniref:TonB-dependent receptor n=1 Tax=Phenylobacterium sp. TaxID=1871053 RepID=UPI002FE3DCF2